MGVALKDLRKKIKRPVRSVKVLVDGDLWAEHDELAAKLEQLQATRGTRKMGDSAGVQEVAEQLLAIEQRMRDAEVTVQFRGIPAFQFKEIKKRFPPKEEGKTFDWDVDAGSAALIAACAVEPTTEEEVRELLDEGPPDLEGKLFLAAWAATGGSSTVPTSAHASDLIRRSGQK